MTLPAARTRALLRRAPLALCGVLLALVLAGCGNNPYPPGQTARPVIYRALGDDPRTLDPSVSYTVTEGTIIDPIYPSYYKYHYLKRDPFVLELAHGAEEAKREPYAYTATENGRAVRKQGEAWTFRIKKGLLFQDDPCFPGGKGREITAGDFLYSFRRMADPSVNCPVLSFFEDKILGFAEYVARNRKRLEQKKPADYDAPVAGLRRDPKDPYTFRILLNQPYPQMRYLMAMHFTTPIPREAVEKYGEEFARHPVGSGAYMMEEYVSKRRIVLKANPNRPKELYPSEGEPGDREAGLLKDAGKQLPLAEKVVYTYVAEPITGWNLFLQGYQDAWGVTQTNFQQVISRQGDLSEEMKRKGVKLNKETSANIYYFAFNLRDPVVGGYTPAKRKLRQAISTAIDAQAFIDLFNQGYGKPAQFLIPPGIFGYDPAYRNPYRQHSVERAKKLLAEAGYPGGVDPKTGERLTLFFDAPEAGAGGRQLVGLLTKQIEAIGINLETRTSRGIVWQDRVDKGQFQFVRYGWFADYPDPENFVFLLYGPNKRPGPNASGYNNPEYNRLFEKMRAMDDGPERLAVIRRLRDIAVEDVPWIYINHDEELSLHYGWLHNVKPHPVSNESVKYYAVEGERRAELQAAWNRPNYWPLLGVAALIVAGSIPAVSTVRQRTNRRARRGGGGDR